MPRPPLPIALLVVALGGALALGCGPPRPRHVVVISMDTTRADALGAYGQSQPSSPRIDAMAVEGVLFQNAVASAPSTLPSHASLFTGKQPYAHGVRSNAGYRLAGANRTLAEVLRERGFATRAEIAAPVLGRDKRLDQGFEVYRDPAATESAVDAAERAAHHVRHTRDAKDITDAGIEFVRSHADRPFLLWLHYFDPHHPLDPPPRFRERLSPYHGEVRRVDYHVGRLLAEIESLGLRDETVVVLTADHGEGMGQHGEDTHSFLVYESTMHVPLIFWGGPRIPRGVRVGSLVRVVDVAPTLLDLLGLPPLEDAQGRSLVPLFHEPDADLGLVGYGESIEPSLAFGSSVLRFVREGSWKYIHKLEPELYDLASDPQELHDLAAEDPERVERMRARLEQLIADAPAGPEDSRLSLDDESLAELQALGYVAGPVRLDVPDEQAALAVSGPDPSERIGDMRELTFAWGEIDRGDYDTALARLRRLETRNPESPVVLFALSEVLRRAGRTDELVSNLHRTLEVEPESLRARALLAHVLVSREELQEAEPLLREALALDPCATHARLLLSEILVRTGRHAEDLALLDAGVADCDDPVALRNALAFRLATAPDPALRDGPRALELARAAVEETRASHPDYLDTLAAAYAELGDFERAIAEQRRALALLEGRELPAGMREAFEAHLAELEAGRPLRGGG